MKWRLRFLWLKARPVTTFLLLMAVPFLPVVPWVMAAGPDPGPLVPPKQDLQVVSLGTTPIPPGAAGVSSVRGPSLPLDPRAVRKAARGWELKALDPAWNLLLTNRFAVRGDIRTDDLRSVGAFAECFLDAIHERLKGDLTDLRLSIRVFKEEGEFQRWSSCRNVEGVDSFYDRAGAEVVLLFGPGTDVAAFCGRLMHGLALEYLDRAVEYRGPDTVAQSIADWFADYEVVKGRVAPRHPRGDVASIVRLQDPGQLQAAWESWGAP